MLTDEQKATVRQWAQDGASLGEIHKRLGEELAIQMTYLEARLLVSELEVSLDKPEDDRSEADSDASDTTEHGALAQDPDEILGGGAVNVSVDSIAQPHAMVSGQVTFSDGKRASWYVDQMGRLGLDPEEPGYRPSEDDLMTFQQQLQETLRKEGL